MTTIATNHCARCGASPSTLLPCASCKVTFYCSDSHLEADYPAPHALVCDHIAEAELAFRAEDAKLRSSRGDFFTGTALTRSDFWSLPETQEYVRACMALVYALAAVDSRASVEARLKHCMGLLKLARTDKIGLRDEILPLMLRLGYDRRCYEFVRWWAIAMQKAQESGVRSGDMAYTLEDVDMEGREGGTDVSEDLGLLYPSWENADVHHLVALALIKSRVLVTLRSAVRRESKATDFEQVTVGMPASDITARLPERHDPSMYSCVLSRLEKQVRVLYAEVRCANEHFWDMLSTATDAELAQNISYPFEMGSKEEALLMTKSWTLVWGDLRLPQDSGTGLA